MTGVRFNILRVRTSKDFKVVDDLRSLGVQAVSVTSVRETVHRRSKARITKRVPFLPGYVFAAVPDGLWPRVRTVTGVLAPLRVEGRDADPATVSAGDVDALQEAVERAEANDEEMVAPFDVGQEVSFDMFGKMVSAIVDGVKGDVVTATTEVNGKRVKVARVADEFRAAA